MGRYFQHAFFPSLSQEIGDQLTVITESEVAFHSSGGIHLLHFALSVLNDTLAQVQFALSLELDREAGTSPAKALGVPSGQPGTLQGTTLLEIPAGPHSLRLTATGSVNAGDVAVINSGVIAAIEFPSWESSDRIEGP